MVRNPAANGGTSNPKGPGQVGRPRLQLVAGQLHLGDVAAAATPTLTNRYSLILADPPWPMQQRGRLGAERHYPLMKLDDIATLPVGALAGEDALLALWVTDGALEASFGVARGWGFPGFRNKLIWIKPSFGLGYWLRRQEETLLLFTKGKPRRQFSSQPSIFYAPRQDHSHKPEEQYAILERLISGDRLELWARRLRHGWDAIGNEVDGQDIVDVLSRLVAAAARRDHTEAGDA